MKLNFWPFNCEDRRHRRERDQAHEVRLYELRQEFMKAEGIKAGVRDKDSSVVQLGSTIDLFKPGPTSCSDCGGLFVGATLKPVTVLRFFSPAQPVVVIEKFFCKKCLPVTNIEVELVSGSGRSVNMDTAYFSTREHWLQPFNFEGEEQTLISANDYTHLYCEDCGVLTGSKKTKCLTCSTPQRR